MPGILFAQSQHSGHIRYLSKLKENDPLRQFYRLLVLIGILVRYYLISFEEVQGFEVTFQSADKERKS